MCRRVGDGGLGPAQDHPAATPVLHARRDLELELSNYVPITTFVHTKLMSCAWLVPVETADKPLVRFEAYESDLPTTIRGYSIELKGIDGVRCAGRSTPST